MMKIISINIRGIGDNIKRNYLRNLISKEEANMVCIQETKCTKLSKESIFLMWGSNEVDWVENGASNSAGGILTVWRKSCFQMSRFINGRNFSIIEGLWKVGLGVLVTIVNVYCPGSLREKMLVWEEISVHRLTQLSKAWCVMGDFNSIRRKEERKSLVSISEYSREIKGFNAFIEKAEYVDISLTSRKFMWYKPNGLVKSRIDSFLVSKEWCDVWPHCKQFVHSRSVSYHCAIIPKDEYVDWGPKLFRSLDVWQSDSRFKVFLRERWPSYEVQGGGMYIFKEKLKKLKVDLKVWNKEIFGNVNQLGEGLQKRINELDIKDEENELDMYEREERRSLLADLNKNLFKQEAI